MALRVAGSNPVTHPTNLFLERSQPTSTTMPISPRRITKILICVLLFLTLANFAAQFFKYFVDRNYLLWLALKFDFDIETSIPTWYSSSMLLLCSILLAIISTKKTLADRYFIHWRVLAIIFLFLSLDEACGFHEMTIKPLRAALNAGGFLYYTWVIPGSAFVIIFVLVYLRFIVNLPTKIRSGFLIAGTLYVGGALCMELVEGRYVDFYGKQNMTYAIMMTIEELLEMLGIVVFIHTLMLYIGSYDKDVQIQIHNE
ncbi:MAG TPA: hypothetical protein ACFYD6_12910 [Candidatus Brocadiia bacterium]|nr:hypothetical protein [Candidatus Brocadiales bacterium]